jgi:hypothetical protein
MNYFKTSLGKMLPKHFKVYPKPIIVKLDENLSNQPVVRQGLMINSLTPFSDSIKYATTPTAEDLKVSGVVKIDDEYIKYTSNDYNTGTLSNLTRGYLNSTPAPHCNTILYTAILAADIDAFTTTITFKNISTLSSIPKNGEFVIHSGVGDDEYISYELYDKYRDGYVFKNCIRGQGGTAAIDHRMGDTLYESQNKVIDQVGTISYDKGLFEVVSANAITASSTEIIIDEVFTATLETALDANLDTNKIYLENITGTVPKNGFIEIDDEIIKYGYFVEDPDDSTKGELSSLVRGHEKSSVTIHSTGSDVLFTVEQTGEILIDDEYIRYEEYDVLNKKLKSLIRGIYGSKATTHIIDSIIYQYKVIYFDDTGLLKIGNEHLRYFAFDEDYFYIQERPLINGDNYYISNAVVAGNIEEHDVGSDILTFYANEVNTYFINLLDVVAEYLDISINIAIEDFANLNDVDLVKLQYFYKIIKLLGENIEEYKWLPIFTGDATEKQIRLFTKELVTIYKEKGTLNAIKLWNKIIAEPLQNYQDLWTFNYNSFYSLPVLSLMLYKQPATRVFYPDVENFYYPQISRAMYEELAYMYRNERLYNHYLTELKLLIKEWNYLYKLDDEIEMRTGMKFDEKIVPGDSVDDLNIYYEAGNVCLTDEDGNQFQLPFNIEDYSIDLFKFENDIENDKSSASFIDPVCEPITTDLEMKSDYDSDWILTGYYLNYCDITDKAEPIATDLGVLIDPSSDLEYAKFELVNSIDADDTTISVRLLEGRFYNPKIHITPGTSPKIVPLGFVVIDDEIISYEDLEFDDVYDTTFINKKFKLLDCVRGKNSTTAAIHVVEPFSTLSYILEDKSIFTSYTEDGVVKSLSPFTYRLKIYRDPTTFNFVVGDTIRIVQDFGGGVFYDQTLPIINIYKHYDYCNETWHYGIDFTTSTAPDINITTGAGTTVYHKIIGYNHKYSVLQHILWRLQNEVNGYDLETVYEKSTPELSTYKINNYQNLSNGILWPTSHFKYGLSVNPSYSVDFTITDIIDLIIKKLKEYKPKHTVAELSFAYRVGGDGSQILGGLGLGESFETEYTSDAGGETVDIVVNGAVAYSYTIPEVQTDDNVDYGQGISFSYIINPGESTEREIAYPPFVAYPDGTVTDSFRRRRRFNSFINGSI